MDRDFPSEVRATSVQRVEIIAAPVDRWLSVPAHLDLAQEDEETRRFRRVSAMEKLARLELETSWVR